MKKILLILVLGLLLSGNAYSKSDIDIAIEKCADTQIFLGSKKDIPKSIYEDHEMYKAMLKERDILQKDYDEYGVIYQATYKKYWKDNPKPRPPKYETMSTYNFEDYKKADAEYEIREKEILKPFTDKAKAMWGSVKKQETLVDEWIRSITAMKLEKMNLKDKAKTIQKYTKKFTKCEEDHNKTPKGFMLSWGN